MSLRARLIAVLLALATVGLLTLGTVTYLEQRSFLFDRVDQQASGAAPLVGHALAEGESGEARGEEAGEGAPPDVSLPPGTYGQLRGSSGEVLNEVVLTYGQGTPSPPRLPADLPPGEPETVSAQNGDDRQYRAVAEPSPQGTTTVVAIPLTETHETLDRLLVVEALVIGGVLIALAVAAWFLVRLELRPLERIAGTAGAIAAGDLSRRVSPATPKTEVGRLGLALNAMLARLEEAFAEREASENRLRHFLADASHELRTPLASIRGYAELFRTGAARDPANTEKAMGRIEDEAARMGVLVEDLLTLARLDEPRERVRAPVDLAAIVGEAVDDARVTAPARDITVSAEDGTVVGDAHQLRQVTGNLLRNALVHTPPATPIEVTLHPNGGEVELAVRDHGPGLPTDEPHELFERFWRAEHGRERGKGGAGLGLAIVAAVVHAHGGRVDAANAPDGGAVFTVHLPTAVHTP